MIHDRILHLQLRSLSTKSHPDCPFFLLRSFRNSFQILRPVGLCPVNRKTEDPDQSILPCDESLLPLASPGSNTVRTLWDLTLAHLHHLIKPWDLQRWSLTDRRDRTCGPHVFAAGTRYFRLQRTPRHLSRTLRPPSCFIKCPVFFIPMQYLRLPPTHKLSPRTCPQSLKQSKDKSKPRY